MGLFSHYRESVADHSPQATADPVAMPNVDEDDSPHLTTPPGEKGLMQSMGEKLRLSAHNVKEVVLGHTEAARQIDSDTISHQGGLAMEEPFSQSDHVLTAFIDSDLRSSHREGGEEEKTMMQSFGEIVSHSAQSVKDVVFGNHDAVDQTLTPAKDAVIKDQEHVVPPFTPGSDSTEIGFIEEPQKQNGHGGVTSVIDLVPNREDEEKPTMLQSVGEMISHSVDVVKEAVLGNSHTDHESMDDVREALLEQESDKKGGDGFPKEQHDEDKSILQTVKEAAQSVKEAVLHNGDGSPSDQHESILQTVKEAAHSVKEAVLSNGDIASVPGNELFIVCHFPIWFKPEISK